MSVLAEQSRAELAQKGFNGMMAMAVARTTPIMPSLSFCNGCPEEGGTLDTVNALNPLRE